MWTAVSPSSWSNRTPITPSNSPTAATSWSTGASRCPAPDGNCSSGPKSAKPISKEGEADGLDRPRLFHSAASGRGGQFRRVLPGDGFPWRRRRLADGPGRGADLATGAPGRALQPPARACGAFHPLQPVRGHPLVSAFLFGRYGGLLHRRTAWLPDRTDRTDD